MRYIIISTCFAFLLLSFPGCGPGPSDQEKKENKGDVRYLTIKGSDTMVHLVSAWAEEFMKLHPGVELSVTGGGSGTGIAGLINGTTDICASSRKIKDKEKELAAGRNVEPLEFKVALDGIAVIVHPENQVDVLSLAQLQDIFTGKFTNWQEVGGADQALLVFSRESSSGTYVFFQEHVMNRQDYTPRARLLPGTSALVQAVSSDKGAIGYVGLGYVKEAAGKVKAISVSTPGEGGTIAPSDQSVKDGSYPISRPLFLYTNGEPKGTAKEFVDFALSASGQSIVRAAGYVAIQN
ncbi:MAG: phosphate ABC transporter substrate-binding protein [Desulfobulbaceae bacterium]|nr:phosphate ABC transporter substrate-binding protein [Desulfobulbaceae bacterium]